MRVQTFFLRSGILMALVNSQKGTKRDLLKAIIIAMFLVGGLILVYLVTMNLWIRIGYPE